MPPLPRFAELELIRGRGNTLEIIFNYTNDDPPHPDELIQKLHEICRRLLEHHVPASYSVRDAIRSIEDPEMTEVTLQRNGLTDGQVKWLRSELKKQFEARVLSEFPDVRIHATRMADEPRVKRVVWVSVPASGHERVAHRAVVEPTQRMSAAFRRASRSKQRMIKRAQRPISKLR